MSMDGEGTKQRRNIAKNFNRLSTDRLAIAYSERELFTFAKIRSLDGVGVGLVAILPFPQIDIIGAMVIVWRVTGKIIRSVR